MTPLVILQTLAPFLPLAVRAAPAGSEAATWLGAAASGLERIAAHPDPATALAAGESFAAAVLPMVEKHLPTGLHPALDALQGLAAALAPTPVKVLPVEQMLGDMPADA